MRTNPFKSPQRIKNSQLVPFPPSQLTTLIEVQLLERNLQTPRQGCLLLTAPRIIQVLRQRENTLRRPGLSHPRRTIGQRSQTLKREDAFRIELHNESFVGNASRIIDNRQLIWLTGDKAKEAKERQERDAENRAHAGHSYHTPDPDEMGGEDELSGLPWGSLSLKHVVSKGRARESDSRRGSRRDEDRQSPYRSQEPSYEEQDAYYEADSTYYNEGDQAYHDYASNSGSYGGSTH